MIKLNTYILTFLIFTGFELLAQEDKLSKEVLSLFSPAATSGIVRYYCYFDNKYEVQLYLANNDTEWKGICYYPTGNTKLYLQGEYDDEKLLLYETDSLNRPAGTWLLDVSAPAKTARWRNIDGSVTFTMPLYVAGEYQDNREYSNNNLSFYAGKIFGDEYVLTLYNSGNPKSSLLNVTKHFYINNKTVCLDDNCDKFEILTKDFDEIKKLYCRKNNDITMKIKITNYLGTISSAVFNLMESLKLENDSYINKDYRFNVNHPVFNDKKINTSFNTEIKQIVNGLKKEMDSIVLNKDDFDDRLNTFAEAWFDVDYYSTKLFSGKFFIQKSYDDDILIIPIIFNLKTRKKINIFEQFNSDFNFNFYVKQYINEYVKNLSGEKSKILKNYLTPKNFKYFTVNNAGIVISTGFNTIYGDYKIMIPFKEVENKIKKRSILHDLTQY